MKRKLPLFNGWSSLQCEEQELSVKRFSQVNYSETLTNNEDEDVILISSDSESDSEVIILSSDEEVVIESDDVGHVSNITPAYLSEILNPDNSASVVDIECSVPPIKEEASAKLKWQLTNLCSEPKNKPKQSTILFDTLVKTMMKHQLEDYALRHLVLSVTASHFISLDLMTLLFHYVVGSSNDKPCVYEPNLQMIWTLLHNMIEKHPPCQQPMRNYYRKVCHDYYGKTLTAMHEAVKLGDNTTNVETLQTSEEGVQEPSNPESIDVYQFAEYALKKRKQQHLAYARLNGRERLRLLLYVFKFFSKLFEKDVASWSSKCTAPHGVRFRRDRCPILVSLYWDTNTEGEVNEKCRELFAFLITSYINIDFRREILKIIAAVASIVYVKDKTCFPELGVRAQNFSRELYFYLKQSPSFSRTLAMIHPPWLRFSVGAHFFNIEEPDMCYVRDAIFRHMGESGPRSDNENFMEVALIVCLAAHDMAKTQKVKDDSSIMSALKEVFSILKIYIHCDPFKIS